MTFRVSSWLISCIIAGAVGYWLGVSTTPAAPALRVQSTISQPEAVMHANTLAAMLGGRTYPFDQHSASMAVPLHGNIVPVVKPLNPLLLQPGMVVVFRQGDRHLVHQVIQVGPNAFIAKGTANDVTDGWIPHADLIGELVAITIYRD
jgi:hypothetical protein